MIYLLRPSNDNEMSRIETILKKKALEDNVKIKIIVWKEIKGTVNNNSEYTKKVLDSYPSIQVLRHPNYLIHFWSHHEKIVIID